MIVKVKFNIEEEYFPSERHTVSEKRHPEKSMNVEVEEVFEEEFPVAFIVHEKRKVSETAESPLALFRQDANERIFSEEIRTYKGKLFRPVRVEFLSSVSLRFEPLSCLSRRLAPMLSFDDEDDAAVADNFSEESVVVKTNEDELREEIRMKAESYVVCNGVAWKECGEPIYRIRTSVAGRGKVNIVIGIEYFLQSERQLTDYRKELANVFNASEKDEAVSRAEKLKESWMQKGNDVCLIAEEWIDVVMPEMVLAEPQKTEQEIRRKEKRKKTKKILKKLRKFIRDESGNEDMEEVVEKVRTAFLEISALRKEF